jgi:hypothetical protein
MNLEHDLAILGQLQPGQRIRIQFDRLRIDRRIYFGRLQRYISGDTPSALWIHMVHLTDLLQKQTELVILHNASNLHSLHILVNCAMMGMQHLTITYPNITWPDWTDIHDQLAHAVKHFNKV